MNRFIALLVLLISLNASANIPVIPQVTNLGSSIQIYVFNQNKYPINCSGMVNFQTAQGRFDSRWYQEYIIAGGTSWKTISIWDFDHIFNVFHSINCIKIP